MPLLSKFPVRFCDFLFARVPPHSEDLVVVSLGRLGRNLPIVKHSS
jgi:hypothetical protein